MRISDLVEILLSSDPSLSCLRLPWDVSDSASNPASTIFSVVAYDRSKKHHDDIASTTMRSDDLLFVS